MRHRWMTRCLSMSMLDALNVVAPTLVAESQPAQCRQLGQGLPYNLPEPLPSPTPLQKMCQHLHVKYIYCWDGNLLSGTKTTRSRPSGTVNSPSPPDSKAYIILAFWGSDAPADPFAGVLPGNSLMYAAGGGATIRFFFGAPAVSVLAGRVVAAGISGGASSVGDIGPDSDRCALAAYPELSEVIVLDLFRSGISAETGVVGLSNAFAAS